MKLSFSTLGCPSWSLARVIDAAGRMGYDGIELRFLEGTDELWTLPELRGAGRRETQARLRDAGLVVACVDSRSFFHHVDPAARGQAVDEAARIVEVAAALGAPGIRVFGDRVQPGADLDSTRRWIADGLGDLREKSRGTGVGIWLETHGNFAPGALARSVIDLAGPEGLGVIWDPANAFSEFGERPADGLSALAGVFRHVHLKDVTPPPAGDPEVPWKPVLMGRGHFPAEDVLEALQGAGYAGMVSFEWEKRWHPEIEEPEVALPQFLRWITERLQGRELGSVFGVRTSETDQRTTEAEEGATPTDRKNTEAGQRTRETDRRTSDTDQRTTGTGQRSSSATLHLERGRLLEHLVCGRLQVHIHPDRPRVGVAAARLVAAEISRLIARDGRAAVIFASAPSQNEFLAELRADTTVEWDKVTAFHLDEYVGMPATHPASFRGFLQTRLFDHVPVAAFHGLDGQAADLDAECARYADLLRRAKVGLAILGIGENGHLAFIDPPFCDFFEPKDVRVVELDEPCRHQQVNDGGFARLDDVPKTALSLTIPLILRVPAAVAIVPGPAKRAAITAALEGPVTRACPASVLRRHPRATLLLDEASAAGLANEPENLIS